MNNNKRINPSEIIYENKIIIYSVVLYIGGLALGAAFIKLFGVSYFESFLKKELTVNSNNFISMFFYRMSVYLTVFLITVLFGMCIIGYPVIYTVPLVTGAAISIKIAYYYMSYKLKGIGYSLLMIIPEAAAFETLLLYSVNTSCKLSYTIFNTVNKKDMTKEINLKSYLKSYLIYFLILFVIASISTLFSYLLNTIITL